MVNCGKCTSGVITGIVCCPCAVAKGVANAECCKSVGKCVMCVSRGIFCCPCNTINALKKIPKKCNSCTV